MQTAPSGYSAILSVAYQTSALQIGRATNIPAGSIGVTFLGEGYFQADTTDEPTSTIRAVVSSVNGNQNIIGHDEDDIFLGGNGDNEIRGGGGRNVLFGGLGNDVIYSTGQDIVNGGFGNDLITFNAGGGTVSFGFGDGHDVVETASFSGTYNLRLDGINLSDISFVVGGYTNSPDYYFWQGYLNTQFLTIKINTTGETITFKNIDKDISMDPMSDPDGAYYTDFAKKYSPLESIQFADGSALSRSALWDYLYQWQNPKVLFDLIYSETRPSSWAGQELRSPSDYIAHINAEYFQAENQTLGGHNLSWSRSEYSSEGDAEIFRFSSPSFRSASQLVEAISAFDYGRNDAIDFAGFAEAKYDSGSFLAVSAALV